MLKVLLWFLLVQFTVFCKNGNHTGQTYYFKMGRNNNEFKVHNRVYFLNHNITDLDFTHKRVVNVKQSKMDEGFTPKGQIINVMEPEFLDTNLTNNHYLDEEWNFNHSDIVKRDLPMFINKFYEKQTLDKSNPNIRILFNENWNTSSNVINLNLNSLYPEETIIDAHLYFYWPLRNDSKIYKENAILRLYQMVTNNKIENETDLIENPDIHKLFNVLYVSKAQKGWQTFKIKKCIKNWLSGEDNLGLLLTISLYENNELVEVFNDANSGTFSTFAVITVQGNDTVQNTGHAVHRSESTCDKTEWTINFKHLGWDAFIISPDGFEASDCTGSCSMYDDTSPHHVKLLYIVNRRNLYCVPLGYKHLTIMFYDRYSNIVIKKYDSFVVTNCGCR